MPTTDRDDAGSLVRLLNAPHHIFGINISARRK
jgi:hypothetical protein